jgi:hypothetical protein
LEIVLVKKKNKKKKKRAQPSKSDYKEFYLKINQPPPEGGLRLQPNQRQKQCVQARYDRNNYNISVLPRLNNYN